MYVSQKKKLWVVKQDATRARDKYNKAMSQLEQSRTATDIQRTEFQQHLNKVTLEQDEAVARALLMDNDDIDFNNNDILKKAKTTVYDKIKVAAPGSSEETIASLKTMQQMQKSHTAIAKKKIVEMEKEKKLIDERVKQLVRRLVEKDSKVKKLEETITYLKGELSYSKNKAKKKLSPPGTRHDSHKNADSTSPSNIHVDDKSSEEKLGESYDMIGLEEITGAMFASNNKSLPPSPPVATVTENKSASKGQKHKNTMWSGSRLTNQRRHNGHDKKQRLNRQQIESWKKNKNQMIIQLSLKRDGLVCMKKQK